MSSVPCSVCSIKCTGTGTGTGEGVGACAVCSVQFAVCSVPPVTRENLDFFLNNSLSVLFCDGLRLYVFKSQKIKM